MNIFNDFELLDFINLDELQWEEGGPTLQTLNIATTAEIIISGYDPTHRGSTALIPCGHIGISGYAPQISTFEVLIPLGTITLTGYNPSVFCAVSIPAASILITVYNPLFGPAYAAVPAAGISLTGYSCTYYQVLDITDQGTLILTGHAPYFGPATAIIPLASALELAAYTPAQSWSLGVNVRYKMQSIFLCILTGNADGLDDLVIPISSFQSTVRDGDPSYLACVIPNSLAYVTDIMARTNGDIIIKQGYKLYDGSIQAEEIIRVDYENMQIARGGRSDSATISGHKTSCSSGPKSVDLEEVSYYGLQTNGKRTFRAKPEIFLRVGDTAVYGTEAIVVGQISYTVDPRQAIMQVTEA